MQLSHLASYISVTTDYSIIHGLKKMVMMHPTGISKESQNITHYLVPIHISESYYYTHVTRFSCHSVSQVSKTGAKLCA